MALTRGLADTSVFIARLTTLEHVLELSPIPIDDDVGRAWVQLHV